MLADSTLARTINPEGSDMRRAEVDGELESLAFDFFYWFSRFEFALKEKAYLQSHVVGERAVPGWDEFVNAWSAAYQASASSAQLLALAPKRQVVAANDALQWKDENFNGCGTELAKVVRLLKNVRNNLFHGGKHGVKDWDDPPRTRSLLVCGKKVLDEFVDMAGLDADYTRYY
jgi:hypothetical protein